MEITYDHEYKKKSKKTDQIFTGFVYSVTGSPEELSEYKESQGEHYRETDSGKPAFFTTRHCGDKAKLIKTSKGDYIPDMSEYTKISSLAEQFPGKLGQAIANHGAAKLLQGASAETSEMIE